MAKKWIVPCLIGAVLLAGCAGAATPAPVAPTSKAAVPAAAEPAWKEEMDKTVAAARLEGKVVAYDIHAVESRQGLSKAFKEKYGMDIEWVSAGKGSELISKLIPERRAGLYMADVVLAGSTTLFYLVDQGVLDPVDSAFILPEVKDPKAWLGGQLPFLDKDHKVLMFLARTGSTIVINLELVKPEEVASYKQLLDPKWKDKIVLNDPSVGGSGNSIIAAMHQLMGENYLRELAKQEPIITRDPRQQVEWVARGKYPIGLGPEPVVMGSFRQTGAPLRHIVPSEGTWSGGGFGGLGFVNKAAHPNATKVFLNWFLSKEGQTVQVKAASEGSRRLDVTTEYIDPERRLVPGVKYIEGDTPEHIAARDMILGLSKEIFNIK